MYSSNQANDTMLEFYTVPIKIVIVLLLIIQLEMCQCDTDVLMGSH